MQATEEDERSAAKVLAPIRYSEEALTTTARKHRTTFDDGDENDEGDGKLNELGGPSANSNSFDALGLNEKLAEHIQHKLGFEVPTPVQSM